MHFWLSLQLLNTLYHVNAIYIKLVVSSIQKVCSLHRIVLLMNVDFIPGFGLAVQLRSPIREALNNAILVLQEQGTLSALKNKWWMEKRGGGSCLP